MFLLFTAKLSEFPEIFCPFYNIVIILVHSLNSKTMLRIFFLFVIVLSTGSVGAQKNTGEPFKPTRKYIKSVKKFNTSVDSSSAEFYYRRGLLKHDHEDFLGAKNDYTKATDMGYGFKAWYNRGMANLDLMLTEEALADFTISIELDGLSEYAYNNRGLCKFMLRDYKGAVQDCSMALTINPHSATALNNRGLSSIKLGLAEEGCRDLYKAQELGDTKAESNIKKYCE